MKVSRMRMTDRWLGVPVCFFLGLVRRFAALWSRRNGSEDVRRILFVKLAEQGSTVLAYPALKLAVEKVGRENVFFLVFSENRSILDILDVIPAENIIEISSDSFFSVVPGAIQAVFRIRSLRIDAAVDLEFFARSSAVLTFLSGARIRVGFHSFFGEGAYRGDLMTHRLNFNSHLHTTDLFLYMLCAMEIPSEQLPAADPPPSAGGCPDLPEFVPHADEKQGVSEMICDALGCESLPPLVLLNANCSDLMPLRRWPSERYISLARRLLAEMPDACVVFTGGPGERESVEGLVSEVGSDRCISLAGRTSIRELLVLYTLAGSLVTNDSGPAHFASLTSVPVVVLFGPETPRLFAARSSNTHVMWAGLPCSPCVSAFNDRRSVCPRNLCMEKISVDRVFDKVCESFDEK